jgi:hypothetical protein
MALNWDLVEERVADADSIAFDGCHKIYVLMDAAQTKQMQGYGYEKDGSQMRYAASRTKGELLGALHEWFDASCDLRFISAVRTVKGDPNDGFETLIGQFDDEEDAEEHLCEGCGTEVDDMFEDYCPNCKADREDDEEDES